MTASLMFASLFSFRHVYTRSRLPEARAGCEHKMKTFSWAILALFIHLVAAHNELIPALRKSCFYEDMNKGDELAVSFQVGNRDPNSVEQYDIDFWIADENGNKLRTMQHVADGDARLEITQAGKYEYCFSNEYSTVKTKDVTFHIHGVVYVDGDNYAPDSLDAQVKALSRLVQEVKNEQGYIVIRERVHRNTAESTNARVKWWSIFQLLVVAANSVFQIYYLKRFFEVKTQV